MMVLEIRRATTGRPVWSGRSSPIGSSAARANPLLPKRMVLTRTLPNLDEKNPKEDPREETRRITTILEAIVPKILSKMGIKERKRGDKAKQGPDDKRKEATTRPQPGDMTALTLEQRTRR